MLYIIVPLSLVCFVTTILLLHFDLLPPGRNLALEQMKQRDEAAKSPPPRMQEMAGFYVEIAPWLEAPIRFDPKARKTTLELRKDGTGTFTSSDGTAENLTWEIDQNQKIRVIGPSISEWFEVVRGNGVELKGVLRQLKRSTKAAAEAERTHREALDEEFEETMRAIQESETPKTR